MLPTPPAGRGLTREQRLRRRIGRTLAGAGCVEVVSFPFVGDDTFDALGLAADDPLRHAVRLSNPLSAEKPLYTTTLLPGVLDAAGRNLGRGATGVALFETGTVAFPVDRGPAPVYGVDRRPSEAELSKLLDALPAQPLYLAGVLSGERDPAGLVGAGPRRPTGPTPSSSSARSPQRSASRSTVEQPRGCPGTRAAARELWSATRRSATPASCTRGSARRFGLPRGTAALEIDLDALHASAPSTSPGRRRSPTTRWPRRTSRSSSTTRVPAAEVEAALREGRASCWSRSGSSTSTPVRRSARARSRWPSRCASAPPTGPSPRARPAPPATPPSPAAAAAVGAVQR